MSETSLLLFFVKDKIRPQANSEDSNWNFILLIIDYTHLTA